MLVKKATQTPRIAKLYVLLKTVLKISAKYKYFDELTLDQRSTDNEKKNIFNMLLTFLKELIGKSEEFQDELLISTMNLLLHVPIAILYQRKKQAAVSEEDNLHLWRGVMIKALE